MSPEEKLPEELKAFEAALASLVPSADRLSRDRVMYLAGQAALEAASPRRKKPRWGWPMAFSAMTAVAATLAVLLVNRPESASVERGGNPVAVASEEKTGPNSLWPQRSVLLPERSDFDDPLLAKSEFPANWRVGSWQMFERLAYDRPRRSATSAAKDDRPRENPSLDIPTPTNRQLMEELFQDDLLKPMPHDS